MPKPHQGVIILIDFRGEVTSAAYVMVGWVKVFDVDFGLAYL